MSEKKIEYLELFKSPERIKKMWVDNCSKENIKKCLSKTRNPNIDSFEKIKSWAIIEYFIRIKNENKN